MEAKNKKHRTGPIDAKVINTTAQPFRRLLGLDFLVCSKSFYAIKWMTINVEVDNNAMRHSLSAFSISSSFHRFSFHFISFRYFGFLFLFLRLFIVTHHFNTIRNQFNSFYFILQNNSNSHEEYMHLWLACSVNAWMHYTIFLEVHNACS